MTRSPSSLASGAAALLLTFGRPGHTQQPARTAASFVLGDWLVAWQSRRGTTIAYRGIPVFAPNPGEFVVHHAWQEVFYRNDGGAPTAALTEGEDESSLTITDRTQHFAFTKRVIARREGTLRVEYEYELLDPDAGELQGLFGIGAQWIDDSKYRLLVGGATKEGELKCPEAGRLDPWAGATEQTFVTDFGTLTLKSERPLNLLCEPARGALWWAQRLAKGEKHTQTLDLRIEPGPRADTGLVLTGLEWPGRVRNGRATFALRLARTATGPTQVRVHAVPATGTSAVGQPVTVDLTEEPREVRCQATLGRKGMWPFAVVIAAAAEGKELLRLAPLQVESAPLFRALPRLSLYTHEAGGEVVIELAEDVEPAGLTAELSGEGLETTRTPLTSRRSALPVDLSRLTDGTHHLTCRVLRGEEPLAESTVEVRKAPPKANEVKIDNLSRGLMVDGLPFIPFGYYTYYPLKEGVIDEEVVRGFNLFSPYHGGPHLDDDLTPVIEYMDRCAAVGMKVNYHLMWANRAEVTDGQWATLRDEVLALRDHPALLSWYIADEPSADRVASLERAHAMLAELDPYHPVTIVFCRGAEHGRKFVDALDIVMADPYPIPNGPVTAVSDIAERMNDAFDRAKPLWIVPQCFGGNEGWRREPTAAEQRSMTYQALIHGATAIQYFIRSPRMSFPKSPAMWSECSTLALEAAELTPALLSTEPAPEVRCSAPSVHVRACRDRGVVTVLAVNTENRPQTMRVELPRLDYTGETEVLFENRKVQVTDGAIEEPIDAFGTRAYALPLGPLPEEDLALGPKNLTVNPSYEDNPSVGTPAGCYANIPPGATSFVDSRVARHGRHSLRLTAPDDEHTPSLSPFPVALKAGQAYRVSLWAKAKTDGVRLSCSLGKLGKQETALTTDWAELAFTVEPNTDVRRAGAGIGLGSAGVAWVDVFQIVPVAGGNGH